MSHRHQVGTETFEYRHLDADQVQDRIRLFTEELVRLRHDAEDRADYQAVIKDTERELQALLQLRDLLGLQALRDGVDSILGADSAPRLRLRTTDAPKDQSRDVELQVQHLTLRVNIGDFSALLAQTPETSRGVPVTVLLDPVIEDGPRSA